MYRADPGTGAIRKIADELATPAPHTSQNTSTVATGVPLLHRNVIRIALTGPSKTRLTVAAGPRLIWVGSKPGIGLHETR